MSKKVIVSPLNWGIGHATRCIPIIHKLLEHKHIPILASDGEALRLLRMEFPDLESYELPSYSVTYPTTSILINVGLRIPRIVSTVTKERKIVEEIVSKENVDLIISDNRFGCRSDRVTSVFLTHQVNLISPGSFIESIVRKMNKKYIRRFDYCWIPDVEAFPGMSGILGHEHDLTAMYIGPLSRMKSIESPKKYDYAVVLSGPEPQRTNLQKEILSKIKTTEKSVAFVGGDFTENEVSITNPNIEYHKLLQSEELNRIFCGTERVICRSGYSTMMDLAVLGKKAIIIPTPGQTEQEYLGTLYEEHKWHMLQKQGNVSIEDHLEILDTDYSGIQMSDKNLLEEAFKKLGL